MPSFAPGGGVPSDESSAGGSLEIDPKGRGTLLEPEEGVASLSAGELARMQVLIQEPNIDDKTLWLIAKGAGVSLGGILELRASVLSASCMAYKKSKILPPKGSSMRFWLLSMVGGEALEEKIKQAYGRRIHIIESDLWGDFNFFCCFMARGASWDDLMGLDAGVKNELMSHKGESITALIDEGNLTLKDLLYLIKENKRRALLLLKNAEATKEICDQGVEWHDLANLEEALLIKCLEHSENLSKLSSIGVSFSSIIEMLITAHQKKEELFKLGCYEIPSFFVFDLLMHADTLLKWRDHCELITFDQMAFLLFQVYHFKVSDDGYRLRDKARRCITLFDSNIGFDQLHQAVTQELFQLVLSDTEKTAALSNALGFDNLLALTPMQLEMLFLLTHLPSDSFEGCTPFIDGRYSLESLTTWSSKRLEKILGEKGHLRERRERRVRYLCMQLNAPLDTLADLSEEDFDYLLSVKASDAFLKHYIEHPGDRALLKDNNQLICHAKLATSSEAIMQFVLSGLVSQNPAHEAVFTIGFFTSNASALEEISHLLRGISALQALFKINKPRFEFLLSHFEGGGDLLARPCLKSSRKRI